MSAQRATTADARAPATSGGVPAATRVNMHCHPSASQSSRLGVQRALGLPECPTPPQELYELAKRRGGEHGGELAAA